LKEDRESQLKGTVFAQRRSTEKRRPFIEHVWPSVSAFGWPRLKTYEWYAMSYSVLQSVLSNTCKFQFFRSPRLSESRHAPTSQFSTGYSLITLFSHCCDTAVTLLLHCQGGMGGRYWQIQTYTHTQTDTYIARAAWGSATGSTSATTPIWS
jgi:hypothetical protein